MQSFQHVYRRREWKLIRIAEAARELRAFWSGSSCGVRDLLLLVVLLHAARLRANGITTLPDANPANMSTPHSIAADSGNASDRLQDLPDAPQPSDALLSSAQATQPAQTESSKQPAQSVAAQDAGKSTAKPEPHCTQNPCPITTEAIDWYKRFMDGPHVKQLTPLQKAHLAARNIIDPFNALTILAQSAFFVGFNSHSPYGPGMTGFGRNVGVSYSQDITSEFFNVFLIPSIVHQDPHYHRMPGASYKRRFFHATTQIFWTLGDNGKGMINYANLVGSGVDIAIGNTYVPGQQAHFTAALSEYFVGLATAPIDNYITEFLPDIARHIHVQIVLVQDIINQVSRTSPPAN